MELHLPLELHLEQDFLQVVVVLNQTELYPRVVAVDPEMNLRLQVDKEQLILVVVVEQEMELQE
tara:strand:- start:61 stop:252 length:192 start_codon:yes stop_codon:yes gene_type:complete